MHFFPTDGFRRPRWFPAFKKQTSAFFPAVGCFEYFFLCFNMTSGILKVKSLAYFPEEAEKALFVVLSKKAALLSGWVGRVVRVAPSLEGTSSPEGALRSSSLLSAALFFVATKRGHCRFRASFVFLFYRWI